MNLQKTRRRILAGSLGLCLAAALPQTFAQKKEGVELLDSGRFQESEKVFREALKSNPADLSNSFYLGLSILFQKNYKDALETFLKIQQSRERAGQQSRRSIPSEYQMQLAMARARIGLKQFPDAWKNLETAKHENAGSADVYVYRGVYYLEQEKHAEAIQELEKAISMDPRNSYAYYYAGIAYYHSGIPDKAVNDLKMFLQLAPNAPEAPEAKSIVDKLC